VSEGFETLSVIEPTAGPPAALVILAAPGIFHTPCAAALGSLVPLALVA
jgi:hypothetical protein